MMKIRNRLSGIRMGGLAPILSGLAVLLLCCSVPARATTVSGTVKLPDGTLVNGTIEFILSQQATTITPPVLFAPVKTTCSVSAGAITSCTVQGNDTLDPAGTFYKVRIVDQRNIILLPETKYTISGASVDLGTLPPTATATLVPPTGSVTGNMNVTGNLTVGGSMTAAGTTTQVTFNNAGVMAGDPELTFTPATNTLTTDTQVVGKWNNTEVVDGVRNITVAQAIARFATGNGTVFVPTNSTPTAGLTISQPNVTLQCLNGAIITKGGNFDLLTLSSTGTIVRDCTFDGVKASFTGAGVVLNGASSATVENNTIRNVASTNGSIYLSGSSRNKIRNNRISLGAGMGIFGEKNSDQNTVEGNFVDTTAAAALANMSAIAFHGTTATQTVNDNKIVHNDILNGGGSFCVEVGAFVGAIPLNTIVANNTCKPTVASTGGGYSIGDQGKGFTMSGNTFDANGFAYTVAAFEVVLATDGSITGNTAIDGTNGSGMICDRCSRTTWSGNVVNGFKTGSGDRAYHFATSVASTSVNDNTITGNVAIFSAAGAGKGFWQQCNAASTTCNNNTYTGNHVLGVGQAGSQGITIENGTGTTDSTLVGPNQIRSVEFGINNSASTNTKIYLGKLTSVTTPILDTGTGTLYEVERATTDTLTNKTYRGTLVTSDQGTACTNGELALSAGWGTTATVTAVVGISQTCKWTITSAGTGQAANPTVTDTLTNALPSASVVCEMRMTGGTGTATLFDQTTLSATAPVFTFQGTPVATSTYIVLRRCGP